MNERYALLVVEVGMSVDVSFVSVGCPPGVTDSDHVVVRVGSFHGHASDAITTESVGAGKLSQDEGWFPCFKVCGDGNDSAAVVAT